MSRSTGKGIGSRRGHVYQTDSSEDESDHANETNMLLLQQKRARSIRALLMDAAARGQFDYSDVVKDVQADPSSMRSLSALQQDFDARKKGESESSGSNTTGPFVIKKGRLEPKESSKMKTQRILENWLRLYTFSVHTYDLTLQLIVRNQQVLRKERAKWAQRAIAGPRSDAGSSIDDTESH